MCTTDVNVILVANAWVYSENRRLTKVPTHKGVLVICNYESYVVNFLLM